MDSFFKIADLTFEITKARVYAFVSGGHRWIKTPNGPSRILNEFDPVAKLKWCVDIETNKNGVMIPEIPQECWPSAKASPFITHAGELKKWTDIAGRKAVWIKPPEELDDAKIYAFSHCAAYNSTLTFLPISETAVRLDWVGQVDLWFGTSNKKYDEGVHFHIGADISTFNVSCGSYPSEQAARNCAFFSR